VPLTVHGGAEREEKRAMSRTQIEQWVKKAVWSQPVSDPHTHTCPPLFGASPKPEGLLLWGVDELVTYHY